MQARSLLSLLLLASCLLSHVAALPVLNAVSRTSDYQRPRFASPDIPLHDVRLQSAGGDVEQVHLMAWTPDSVTVVFARDLAGTGSGSIPLSETVHYGESMSDLNMHANASGKTYTTINIFNSYLWEPPMGAPTLDKADVAAVMNTAWWSKPWMYSYYNFSVDDVHDKTIYPPYDNPLAYYASPLIYTATMTGLKPKTQYYYRIGSFMGNFTTLPVAGDNSKPLRIGLWADVGQTNVSALNMEYMNEHVNPDVVMLAGDLSYADTYAPRWDTWGRLMQPLMSTHLNLICNGNHEVASGPEQNMAYSSRYPAPHRESGSPTFEYFSYETGLAHIVALGSYTVYNQSSLQYRWLENDLRSFNRSKTPWLILFWHTPTYTSNFGQGGATLLREWTEDLLYKYGVDIVLYGHIHEYERTAPVYKNQTNPCGPVYLTLGDAGNREGPTLPWLDPQPSWSLFREASFGVGSLELHNSTTASFSWHRVACEDTNATHCKTPGDNSAQAYEPSDSATFVRDTAACPNRAMPS
ncbi:hypothetical protein CDCA_CDCA02G0812 [Cyanidium caldarium]|uniref:Purple acid phosphatase n=1 Tax=Cyanidium caldarium TaxID=2771 RepID=A0AAV9IRB4_CYACA|nr:hypothetical protein CDCA_CDCA02G0812 [Cyanidium caldarium]